MTDDKTSRWENLTAKYRAFLARNLEANKRASLFVEQFRLALAEACGCDEEHVVPYKYKRGWDVSYDVYERVETSQNALVSEQGGWTFALGLLLEPGPHELPRMAFRIPFGIDLTEEHDLIISSVALTDELTVTRDGHQAAVRALAEQIYKRLEKMIDGAAVETSAAYSMGFVTY